MGDMRAVKESFFVGREDYLHGLSVDEVVQRLGYGTFVGENKRYVFVETPKAACSTMKWVLSAIEGKSVDSLNTGRQSTAAMRIHRRENCGIPSVFALSPGELANLLENPSVIRFAVVRNPYARLVSAWADKIRQREPGYGKVWAEIANSGNLEPGRCPSFRDFAEWVLSTQDVRRCDHHWRGMTWLLLPDLMRYTHVLRTESLVHDLTGVLAEIAPGFSAKECLTKYRVNESVGVFDWRAYYDEVLASRIFSFYREDFERFGYDRESWRNENEGRCCKSDSPEVLKNRVDVLEEQALEAIRARNAMIESLVEQADVGTARLLNRFIAQAEPVPKLLRNLAAVMLKSGHPVQARELLLAAHKLMPRGKRIRMLLAESLIATGKSHEARGHLETLLADPIRGPKAKTLLEALD